MQRSPLKPLKPVGESARLYSSISPALSTSFMKAQVHYVHLHPMELDVPGRKLNLWDRRKAVIVYWLESRS